MSNAENFIKRLDQYIEYAEATKRFADVGFYEELKQFISIQSELDEALRKQREEIKSELIASVNVIFRPHIEGVFGVIENKLNATIEDE